MNDSLDLEQINDLALELINRSATIAAHQERCDEIRALLCAALPVGLTDTTFYKIRIKAGSRRLNAARIAGAFPAERFPQLYRQTLDTAAVKREFAPTALAEFQDVGKPIVEVSCDGA